MTEGTRFKGGDAIEIRRGPRKPHFTTSVTYVTELSRLLASQHVMRQFCADSV